MELHAEHGRGYKKIAPKGLNSRFYILHPFVLLLYYIDAVVFSVIFTNPVFVFTVFVMMFFMAVYYAGGKKAIKSLKMSALLGIFILIVNPLINHRGSNILIYLFDNPITLEAVVYGSFNMIMIMSMLLLFVSFNTLLNSERFLYLFSKVLPKVSFIISMSLRYVSLFSKRAKELISVVALKGIDLKKGKKTDIIKNSSRVFLSLTEWSLEDGMCIAQTLKAKEYSKQKRVTYQKFFFTIKDIVNLLFLTFSTIFLFIAYTNGAGQYSYYPRLLSIKFETVDVLAYVLIFLILGLPFIYEVIFFVIYKIRLKRNVISFDITQKSN